MIEKYTKKDGTVAYQFQIYLGIDPVSGKPIRTRRRGFKTKREATIAESQLRTEFDATKYKNSSITFEQLYDMWLPHYEKTVRPSTVSTVRYNVDNTILPTFGKIKVKDITVLFCQQAINKWADMHTQVVTYKSAGSMILDFAVQMGIINFNPFTNTKIPRRQFKSTDDANLYYNSEELRAFLNLLKDNIKKLTIFRLLAFTGMRKGELLALTWGDINFDNATLSINKTVAWTRDGATIHPPKTPKSKRVISLDTETLKILRKWKLYQASELLKSGFNANKNNQFVFVNLKTNKILSFAHINITMSTICDKHNFKKIKVHGFRHTHCSLLFESGATIQQVQDRLGHDNIQTTMNVYAHVTQKQRDNLADKFASYIGM